MYSAEMYIRLNFARVKVYVLYLRDKFVGGLTCFLYKVSCQGQSFSPL
jgi:hypothetical protein